MKPRTALLPLLALVFLAGGLAAAPLPLTAPFNLTDAFAPIDQWDHRGVGTPGAAELANGDLVVAWFYERDESSHRIENGLEGRLLSFQGQVGKHFEIFHETLDPFAEQAECPAFAADGAGGFIVAYERDRQVGVLQAADRFAPGLRHVQHFEVSYFISDYMTCPAIAAAPDGRFVVGWSEFPASNASSSYMLRAFSPDGQPLMAEPMTLGVTSAYPDGPPAVGMDRTGRFVAVWGGGSSLGLTARRFTADGTPAGAPFQIAASYASDPVISMAPEGDFAIAYTKPAPTGKPHALVIRRFAADGSEIGAPVSPGTVAEFISPRASTDRYGNFVLYWLEKGRTYAQIFNRSRTARGTSFDAGPRDTAVALADSGRLLTVWPTPWPADSDLRGRIWRGLKEDSYCVYRGNAFLCDAAVNGQEVPAAALGLGYPTDVPLLGDVDGDGRVDACTHRGNRFLCDTKHDGGTAEVKITFGNAGEPALLGDVNGDGRADPCIHRGALFLCDTKHDGGTAEVKIAFGVPGDLGLLGDVNGDGKADVCIYRSGLFACDTAHDGVFAEVKLDLRPALQGMTAGVPLLGDIDGDGRADACLLRGAELTCGLFDKTGGAPYAVVDRPVFPQPGDLPLLGGLVN